MKKSLTTGLLISTVFSSIAQARIESPTLSTSLMTSHLSSLVNRPDILNLNKEITAKEQQDIALSFSENSGNDGFLSSSFGSFVAINTLTKPKNKFESSRGKVEETRDIGYRGYNRPIFHTKDQSEIANHSPSNPSYSLKREPLIVSTDTLETPYKKHRDTDIPTGGNEDSPSQKANKLGSSVARNQIQSSMETHESGVTSGVTKDAEGSTTHVSATSKTSMPIRQRSNNLDNQRIFVEPSAEKQILEDSTKEIGGKSPIHVVSDLSATSTGEQTTKQQILEDSTQDVSGKTLVHVASDLSATSAGEQNNKQDKQETEIGISTTNAPPPPPPPLTNTPPPPPFKPTAAQLRQTRVLNSVKKDDPAPTISSGRPDLTQLKNGRLGLKKTGSSLTSSSTAPDKGEVARWETVRKLTKGTGLVDELNEKVQQISFNLKKTGNLDKLLTGKKLDTPGNQESIKANVTLQDRPAPRPGSSFEKHLKTQEEHDKTNKQGLNITLRKTENRERLIPPVVQQEVVRAIEVASLAQGNEAQDNSVTSTPPSSLINQTVVEEPTVTTGEPTVTTTGAIVEQQVENTAEPLPLGDMFKSALVAMNARFQEPTPVLDSTDRKKNIIESLQTHKDFFNYGGTDEFDAIRVLVDSAPETGIEWLEREISKAKDYDPEWGEDDDAYSPDAFLRAAQTRLKQEDAAPQVVPTQKRQVGKLVGVDKGASLSDVIKKRAMLKGLIQEDTAEEPKIPAVDLVDTNSTSGNVGSSTSTVTPGFTPPPPPLLNFEEWSGSARKDKKIGSDVVVPQESVSNLPKVEEEENDVVVLQQSVSTLPKVENGSEEAENFVPPALKKPEIFDGTPVNIFAEIAAGITSKRHAFSDESDDEEDDGYWSE